MTWNIRPRTAGALACSGLALTLICLTATPVAAAAPVSDGAYYLYDSGTETRFPGDHVNAWSDDLVASPSATDARARFTCAADAQSVQTFISPVGSERARSSWIAYSDSAFYFSTKDVLEPSANLEAQVLGSAGQVKAAGGDYSVGFACLKSNGVQFASAGLWFTKVHVTAGSGDWKADQLAAPLALTATPTPTITGTAAVGKTLTAVSGTWSPSPVSLSYQWSRGGIAIPGATASTYLLTGTDAAATVTVTVTGSKPGYATTSKASAATATVAPGTLTTAVPKITGTAAVGSTLTVSKGTWKPSTTTFTYQWKRGGASISGATKSSYTLVSADVGATLTVTVSGSATGYKTASKTSAATTAILNVLTAKPVPTISGTAKVGSTVSAQAGTWSPAPVTLTYAWSRAGTPITGATSSKYVLVAADAGAAITVTVTGTKTGYVTASQKSAAIVPAK